MYVREYRLVRQTDQPVSDTVTGMEIEMRCEFTIRRGELNDLPELKKLFVDTITSICKADYDADQIDAWISDTKSGANRQSWYDMIINQFVLVAQYGIKIVGFATLDDGNHIDLFYVHKDHQRQGIASRLYIGLENEARRQHQTILTADISKAARRFFVTQKFNVLAEQVVNRKGVDLINYKMIKSIDNNQTASNQD
jgi:putative acetyltransferase